MKEKKDERDFFFFFFFLQKISIERIFAAAFHINLDSKLCFAAVFTTSTSKTMNQSYVITSVFRKDQMLLLIEFQYHCFLKKTFNNLPTTYLI